ncbi:MAG: orotidine 5'-phosphate decarboxylase [Acidimicrobiales bacterium]|nr:orotidine 5'-phosphate decarboxylase [Acidimicrobiales bacterium]
MVELQAALDITDLDRAVDLAARLSGTVDRIEVGTPLILRHGVGAIAAVKAAAPDCVIVADCKTMDCGGVIVALAIEHGADGVIVQGAAPLTTVRAAAARAAELHGFVMVDDLGVRSLQRLADDISGLAVNHVIIHTGKDEQIHGATPAARLVEAAGIPWLPPLAVAGGIDAENLGEIVGVNNVDVVIVGQAIYGSEHPVSDADRIHRLLAEWTEQGRVSRVGNGV